MAGLNGLTAREGFRRVDAPLRPAAAYPPRRASFRECQFLGAFSQISARSEMMVAFRHISSTRPALVDLERLRLVSLFIAFSSSRKVPMRACPCHVGVGECDAIVGEDQLAELIECLSHAI